MKNVKSTKHVIETNPEILGGKPVVKGTRIPVTILFDMASCGYSIDQILEQYPTLTKELVIDVLKIGSVMQECLKHFDLREYLEKEIARA